MLSWLVVSLSLAVTTSELSAANGDVLNISDVLGGITIVDLTQDSGDGSFWVLGDNGSSAETHRIYHVSSDFSELQGAINNPHPAGAIPNLTTNRGIAYRSLSSTFLVLSSVGTLPHQEFVIREVDRFGVEVPASQVTVVTPDEDASLYGLAYDILTREFWTFDDRNDKALRVSAAGETTHSFAIPGKVSDTTRLRGKGIAFALDGIQPRVWVAYGDIFSAGPTKIVELAADGVPHGDDFVGDPTGFEIPLDALPAEGLRGFQIFNTGFLMGGERVAMLDASGLVYEIDYEKSTPLPPTEVSCSLTLTNQVHLAWTNNGDGPEGAYGGAIQIQRNGVLFTMLEGDATEFIDASPVDGTATYSLRASQASGGPLGDFGQSCSVTVGTGGLVDWAPFPGASIYDLTEDPVTRNIYVTDNLLETIFHLDADLQLLAELPSPWGDVSAPGGIAFVPSIELGFPPQEFTNLLAVAESTGNRLRLIDPNLPDAPVITTLSLRFNDAENPVIAGLSYIASAREFLVLDVSEDAEGESGTIYRFSNTGNQLYTCVPGTFLDERPRSGIAYDPILQTALVVFGDGLVREFYPDGTCPLSDYQVPLVSLGPRYLEEDFTGGIEISDNTLLLCGRLSNAIFRVLLFPFSPHFVRGDFTRDAGVDISDAVASVNYLFISGDAPTCQDAVDANDDGILDVSDPVYLLFHLFVPESPPPPAPFPGPGLDPTFRDNLGCEE